MRQKSHGYAWLRVPCDLAFAILTCQKRMPCRKNIASFASSGKKALSLFKGNQRGMQIRHRMRVDMHHLSGALSMNASII